MSGRANRGKGLEWWLANTFSRIGATCGVKKTDPPVRIIRQANKGGKMSQFVGCFTARAVCDFEGWYRGLHVCCEAKDCKATGAFYPVKAIKEHQMDRMVANDVNGGISFLALRFRHDGDPKRDTIALANVAGLAEVIAFANPRKGLRPEDFTHTGNVMLLEYGMGCLTKMETYLEMMRAISIMKAAGD